MNVKAILLCFKPMSSLKVSLSKSELIGVRAIGACRYNLMKKDLFRLVTWEVGLASISWLRVLVFKESNC